MKRLLIATVACAATLAHAEFYSGNDLYYRMISPESSQRILAQGYVAGVADAAYGTLYCPAIGVTLGQLVDMTKSLLEKNPDQRHKTADSFVMHAISTAFPCAKSKKGSDV